MKNDIEAAGLVPQVASPGSSRRWWIVAVLFASTLIDYVSRQTFSVLSPLISQQMHLTHDDLGKIIAAFQIAYALTWFVGGGILDVIGARIGLAAAVIWWSAFNLLTGFARNVSDLIACRFMLGVGEGFNWPGASKVVAEWFPAHERSLAVAIFDSGSSVGGALTAIAIPPIALAFGMRWAFVVSSLLGVVWLLFWWRAYPSRRKVIPPQVQASESGDDALPTRRKRWNWRQWSNLAKDRNTWGIFLGRSFTESTWWFYVFWLPQYLSDARGFSLHRIAMFAWIPFVAADLGNFTGGWISGYFIRRGAGVVQTRLWVCTVSCIPMLASILVAKASDVYTAMLLICVALWGYASWSTMGLTLPSDLFDSEVVASVTGLSGLGSGIVSAAFSYLVGVSVSRYSYFPAFVAAGLLPVLATASVLWLVRSHPTVLVRV